MIRIVSAVVLIGALLSAHAQDQMIRVNVDLVNIYFTVCNKKGRPIRNMARESFDVFEDDNRQVITNFSRETDVPLALVLLVDTSGSVRYTLNFEREAATQFLYSTLRTGSDKAALFTFDSTVDLRQDYTDDVQSLVTAVDQLQSGGGTRLFDSLYFILNEAFHGRREARRGIILLTDGDDNSSRTSPQAVVEAAQRNNVAIYAISVSALDLLRRKDSNQIDGILEMFAAETGGKVFFPTAPKQLAQFFQLISSELRSQYTLAYRSTNAHRDGTFRRVRIEVNDASFLVRSRSGYFAPVESVERTDLRK